jgi:hypothetical protein
MVNELDAARIDPLLSWSVSRVVSKTLDYIVNRSESLVRIYQSRCEMGAGEADCRPDSLPKAFRPYL